HAYDGIPTYEGVPQPEVRCFPELLRESGYYCTNAAKTDYQFKAPATAWDQSDGKAHWRNRAAGQPFFAVFNHHGTHESQAFPGARLRPAAVAAEDVPVPPIYPDTPAVRDALARTYNNIAAMDAWVGDRLAELEAAELLDSTVVFVFSDHGVGLPRGKRSPTDLGTRVPLLVRLPGGESRRTERVVSFVDFAPSVLHLAGVELPPSLPGRPFAGADLPAGRGFAFTHADRFDAAIDSARSVTDGRWRYVRNYAVETPFLIANAYRERLPMTADIAALSGTPQGPAEQWMWRCSTRPAEELYDSQADPWEARNLAGDPEHAATLERLRRELDAWIERTGDLGLVLPEERMVAERLWPDLEQPLTAPPTLERTATGWRLTSTTPGASLGYRAGDAGPWNLGAAKIDLAPGTRFEALAHRIGYAPARVRLRVPASDS
ncbi:MAG: sulfatase-like hydrolase/transferase, partial [Planctomycetota bacterium]